MGVGCGTNRWFLPVVVVASLLILPGVATAWLYQYEDNFQTDKARYESSHSLIVPGPPPAESPPVLYYAAPREFPGLTSRCLVFEHNLVPGYPIGDPFLAYPIDSSGMPVASGFIEFDVVRAWRPDGFFTVSAHLDENSWLILGTTTPGTLQRVSIPPDLFIRGVMLEGFGAIDNLKISVTYVPEPQCIVLATALCLACAARRSSRD